jgi:hypothetical protein
MAETVKKQTRVLVIGSNHNIQRHQDTNTELEVARAEFEKLLRQLIKGRNVNLIAEEAGDDTEVWKPLKQEEEALGEFAEVFGGGEIVDAPVPTIAKKIADEPPGELRHVDIRALNAKELSIEERDAAMAAKVREVVGDTDSILVIVGEDHRVGVAKQLKAEGMSVECLHFSKIYERHRVPLTRSYGATQMQLASCLQKRSRRTRCSSLKQRRNTNIRLHMGPALRAGRQLRSQPKPPNTAPYNYYLSREFYGS